MMNNKSKQQKLKNLQTNQQQLSNHKRNTIKAQTVKCAAPFLLPETSQRS